MPVCYFNNEYDNKYKCDYVIEDNAIEVVIEYDIQDEIESINGVKSIGIHTKYNNRDIVIIDYNSKKNFYLKSAYYFGHTSVYGTPDSGTKTKFRSQIYFEHSNMEKLSNLPINPKINRIKIFSKNITDWIGKSCLSIKDSESDYNINLTRKDNVKEITIGSNYIKKISISNDWQVANNFTDHNITIDFCGYIEIELTKKINCESIYEFVYELMIFMQLYCPNKFLINKLCVMINNEYYELHIPKMNFEYKDKYIQRSVKVDLLTFLNNCYTTIPYRNSKSDIRNIPYIIFMSSKNLEDNFLTFYRFIECYYKKQSIPNIKTNFIFHSIITHYANKNLLSDDEIEKLTYQIISLRNHYVHSGYYIKNSSIKIKFKKINNKTNPKNYTENNVDFDWIYEKTKILYKIAVDIIYSNMLGYTDYTFNQYS